MTGDSAPAAKPRWIPAVLLISSYVGVASVAVVVTSMDIRSLQMRVSQTEGRLSFLTFRVMVLSAAINPPPPPRDMLHTRLSPPTACVGPYSPPIQVDAP